MGTTADDFNVGGALAVTGASTLTGAVTMASTLAVTGAITATGGVVGEVTDATLHATTSVGKTGANGQSILLKELTEETTMAQAATTATTIEIPAGCILLAVCGRVTGLAATTATYDIGITGDTARFGSGVLVAAGTTFKGVPDVLFEAYASATTILVTPNATPTDDNGKIRFSIFYLEITPPTS